MAADLPAVAPVGTASGLALWRITVRALARGTVTELFLSTSPVLFGFAFGLAFFFPKFAGEVGDLFFGGVGSCL